MAKWRLLWALALPAVLVGAATGPFEWIQTARVFLIDAYEPPFATRLEYDAGALAETMAHMHANTIRISTMGKYALIPGVRFTPHPELGARDILRETIAAAKPRGIRVVPYISTGHKLAWRMVTETHPEYAHRSRPGGGPLRSHMFSGEDHGTVCWNTPYRQAYFELVEKVVRDYDIDGIYFDTWRPGYFWSGRAVCYCDGCRDGFRRLTGAELPWHEHDADYTPAEEALIARYHAWQKETLAEIVREVRKLIKSHKNIPLIYNINNPLKMDSEDPRILEAMDAFLYERGDSMLERAEGVSLARAAGLGVWPYVGAYDNWPRSIHNAYDFTQQIFTTAMFGGAPILAQPYGYVRHEENRRFVAEPFGVLARNEDSFAGFRNVPHVAVVYAYRNPPGSVPAGWWWKADARTASLGAFAACLYGHVQVASVHEGLLDSPDRLRAYRVLYLAGVAHLNAARIENVRRFVREGGGLVVSAASTLYDASGKRLERFALEDVLRVAPIEPAGELRETLASYRTMTGGPYDLYLAPRGAASASNLIPLWHYEPVRALDGGEVRMDIVTGEGPRAVLPGVVAARYGKGRAIYCSSALESLFAQTNNRAVGEAVRALVALAGGESPYRLEAPEGLLANLTSRGDSLVLHLTNWTGSKLERAGANAYDLAPVENVRARILIPAGKRVRRTGALVDAPYRQQTKGGAVEITIPRIEAYQAIRVDLE